VLDLDADTITADSIFTQDLYVGASGNGSIGLLGTTTQITVTDENGQDRIIMGELGTGNTNWGIQAIDENGDVVFQTGSTTFIDGVIINNASINDAQINTLNGSKLTGSNFIAEGDIQSNAVTAAKINVSSLSAISANVGTLTAGTINATVSVNAGSIDVGTLTANNFPVSIEITGSGALLCRNGGDIIMRHSGSGDDNLMEFQTSGGTWKGRFGYNSTFDYVYVNAASSTYIRFGGDVDFTAQIRSDLDPETDSTYDIGTSGVRWRNIWGDTITGASVNTGDLNYENGVVATEPNHVYSWADPDDGVLFMDQEWQPITWIHKNGTIETRGKIIEDVEFKKPDIARRESPDDRRKHNGAKKKGRR
jgi:hypothetical protein